MDLRSQLPKIGTEIDGQVCLGDDEFFILCGSRPDYEKLKTGYATESRCVEALIGIGFPPEVIEKLLKRQWDKAQDAAPDKTISSDHPAFVRYVEVTRLFHEIMTDIDIGIAEGRVRVVLDYEGQSEVKSDWKYWEFSGLNILDTDTFFSWMHERGYPIPDELKDFLKGSLPIDYSCLTEKQQREHVLIWKKKGPKHKTNKEIMLALWPEESKEIVKFNDKDPVFARLRGRIRTREGKR